MRDGDIVKAGDLLVRLDETVTRANLAIVKKTLNEQMARTARLLKQSVIGARRSPIQQSSWHRRTTLKPGVSWRPRVRNSSFVALFAVAKKDC